MNDLHEELIVSAAIWDEVVPAMQVPLEADAFAVGTLKLNSRANEREYQVLDLRRSTDIPQGADHPPLCERLLIVTPRTSERRGAGRAELERLIRQLNPLANQIWIVLIVGLGADQAQWTGGIWERGEWRHLTTLRLVGSGLLVAQREGVSETISPEDELRWSRTRGAIGADAHDRLRNLSVLLLGAGRIGSQMAFQLAALGIKRLFIVDGDCMGVENLDAMPNLTLADAQHQRPKALALQRRLRAFRPDMILHAIPTAVTSAEVTRLAPMTDLILTCVDNDTPRLAAAFLAHRFCRPHVDIATSITHQPDQQRLISGDVRLMLPGQGCVVCVGGLPQEADARYELFGPPDALQRRRPLNWNEQRAGSLITLNQLVCGVAGQVLVDLVTGKLPGSQWHRLRWIEGRGLEANAVPANREAQCRVCSKSA